MVIKSEFTEAETDRQDFVDNQIHGLLQQLAGKELEWDIEIIGEVRDVIQHIFEARNIMTEMEFYPYREDVEMKLCASSKEKEN